jgi:PAS domain S-box-containing protein
MPTLNAPPGPDLFKLLVDRVKDYAIFALDPNGIVSSWNTGAQNIKGYSAHEIIGHHFSRFYPEEAIRSGWPQTELEHAKRDGRFEDEGWRIRKDGTRFWANVVITALYDDEGTLKGFAKVTRDLTEKVRMQRLEADATMMGEFVAMLAHELRNPLAPIRSAINIAQHPAATADKLAWAHAVIDRQSSHLSKLVEDLLDVSRITRGRIKLERRRVRMGDVVDQAIEATGPACEAKKHKLMLHIEADPYVRGDAVRLTQILSNLISNACKYTPNGGRIDITLAEADGSASVTIRDTGIGMPADLMPRVFDMFTQDRRALDRSEGGLGLGLAIARRLAEMHRGTLLASSAGRGCGSEFVLRLPVFVGGEPGRDDANRLIVLIVDDNEDAAMTLQSLLELQGHQCSVAFNAEEGLETARRILPDIALIDIGLPGMNGYELARHLRNAPELEGIKLAAVTGYGGEEDRREALDSGFDEHFAKPVTFDTLVRRMPILATDS